MCLWLTILAYGTKNNDFEDCYMSCPILGNILIHFISLV